MSIFTFETTIEGVELEVEVEYHEHEARTLEHPGVDEGCDVLGIKILSEGADIMALLETAAHSERGGYDGFIEKLSELALADFRGTEMDALAESRAS